MPDIIYKLVHPVTYKIIYIGKTCLRLQRRLGMHRTKPSGTIGKIAIGLHLKGLKLIISPIHTCNETENWEVLERHYISFYKRIGHPLVNCADGGIGMGSYKKYIPCTRDKTKSIYVKNIITGEIIKYNSQKEAAESLKVTTGAICMQLKLKGVVNGYLLSRNMIFEQSKNSLIYNKNKYVSSKSTV